MPSDGIQSAKSRTVLFVTSTIGYGGSEKHLLELISRMGESGGRLVILCAKADPYTERLNGRYGTNVSVRSEQGLKSIWSWFLFFRDTRPEAVVFVYGTLLDIPWYASAAARLAGVRKLYAIQHLIPPPLPPPVEVRSIRDVLRHLIGKRARRLLSARVQPTLCDKTICVSNAVRQFLVQDYRFPPKRTVTIHNGVSLSTFAPHTSDTHSIRRKLGLQPDDLVLVCTARLSEEKGLDILLLAMAQILQRNLSCKCIIVGEGYLKENLLEQIRTLGLTHHVYMEGFQEDVRPYLFASDVFVLTSHREGLPFAVLEAMACGLPCIVTDVGGNAEAVMHNVNGLVVNAGSVTEVAEAISYLLTHPQERERMSSVARSRACEEFDIEARMAEIKQIILN